MTEFLGELYISRQQATAVEQDELRVRAAADQLTGEGCPVRLLRTIFVPEDETCFYLFEAPSAAAVRRTAHRAALRFERIAEAAKDTKGGDR